MAGVRSTSVLLPAAGVLLLLSHAAAWHLGRRDGSVTASSAHPAAPVSTIVTDPAAAFADLIRTGREHEAARQAAEELKRWEEDTPWRVQVAAARAKIPADADVAALAREGMAAAKRDSDDPSAETVAAFGLWLGMDSDAALDHIGRASRTQVTEAFRFEIADWLGQAGNQGRFGDLTKRFPQAAWPLHLGAQALCHERGAGCALEMATSLTEPRDRLWLLKDCLDAEQWRGHLARVPALFTDPRLARQLLSSIASEENAAILLDELRTAGFPPEAVELVETSVVENAEYARRREVEEEADRKRRAESASALTRQLGLAGANVFDKDTPSEEQQLDKLAPGFADALADLRDGRQSMQEVLAHVQRTWPPAADPAVAAELREMLFETAFTADPVGTLQAARTAGWDFDKHAVANLNYLSPDMILRVITARPELLQDRESEVSSLFFFRFQDWLATDPDACRQALLGLPDEVEVLRTQWLQEFDGRAKMAAEMRGGVR